MNQKLVGLIVPARNTEAERQAHRILGPYATVCADRCATKVTLGEWRSAAEVQAMAEANRAAEGQAVERLRIIEPDVLLIGETHSLLREQDVRAYEAGLQRLVDVPCVHWVESYLAAFERLGRIKAVGVLTPFSVDPTDVPQVESWQARGVEIRAIQGFGCVDARGIAAVTKDELAAAGRACVDAGAEAVLPLCTNFNCLESIESIEESIGVPLLPINAVLAWQCMRVLGVPERPTSFGHLLSLH